jgi:hypothetical protein
LCIAGALAAFLSLASHSAAAAERQDSQGLAIYGTPLDGLTAASRNLLDYWKRGWNSVERIVTNRSVPEDSEKTAWMIGRIAEKLGVDAKQPLDLLDPRIHIALLQALMGEEAADIGPLYGPQDYQDAFRAALQTRGLHAVPTP